MCKIQTNTKYELSKDIKLWVKVLYFKFKMNLNQNGLDMELSECTVHNIIIRFYRISKKFYSHDLDFSEDLFFYL